jgi:TolA-binding protein
MVNTSLRLVSFAAAVVLVTVSGTVPAQDADSESFAKRKYDLGLKFLNDKKYDQALKELQSTVDSYPKSRVADAALLRIAEYQLDVAADTTAAQTAVDRLIRDYEKTDSGPMAYVLAGRIILAKGRTPEAVAEAVANYERAPSLFPGSDAVPASFFYTGEAYWLSHRDAEAIVSFRQVSTEYPASKWAPRAMLCEARCLVSTGKSLLAMELLQRVRQRFQGTPEADTAVTWNTILYRLYLRPLPQAPYQFVPQKTIAGPGGKLKDIKKLAISAAGRLYAATSDQVVAFDLPGNPVPGLQARDVRSIMFDRNGLPVLIGKEAVMSKEINSRPLGIPKPDGTLRFLNDVSTGVLTSRRELLVSDSNTKSIARFSPEGKYVGPAPFARILPEELAIDATDRVASIDQDGSGISIIDHSGEARPKIPPRGANYQFDKPVDIAFDVLGHIYVLDRNKGTVWIFASSPQPKLVTSFTIALKAPGVFRGAVCFALDSAGRLYIYDDDVEKVQVYQ